MMRPNKVFVFDLDDTLYKEIDFLKSAYREIGFSLESQFGLEALYDEMLNYYYQGLDVFQEIINIYRIPVDKDFLINMYREHKPDISMDEDTVQTMEALNLNTSCKLGIITDGRTVTQKNKIRALGIDEYVAEDAIIISEECGHEKKDGFAHILIEKLYPDCEYVYVGDNPEKDFIAANKRGWKTVCLMDNGRNIHRQFFTLGKEFLPKKTILNIKEIIIDI